MKKYSFLLFIILFKFSFAQENIVPVKNNQKVFCALDFLSVEMPLLGSGRVEDNLGIVGIHCNLDFGHLYSGLGMYGAVAGQRGGFFTLGVNAGLKFHPLKNIFIDSRIHFGGGGGANTPDGGGAFLLPSVSLGVQFKKFSLSTGYSYINFFDGGAIESHQLTASLQIPLSFDYATIEESQKRFNIKTLQPTSWNKKPKQLSCMLHLNQLYVDDGSKISTADSVTGRVISLAGFEFNSYFNKHWFLLAKFDGAYNGIKAGYMDILLGGGYHLSFNRNRTNILAKLALGAGGGGGVETQGGVLLYPDISIEQHIAKNVYLSLNKGFLMSPNSYFMSSTWGAGLKYYLNVNGVGGIDTTRKAVFKGVEVIVTQDIYLQAARINGTFQNLFLIALQLNYNVNRNVYFTGQVNFADFGNAGAYAEGIVGMGFQTNYFIKKRFNIFLQGLGGGAGGGEINTGQGLILKPSAGFNFKISSKFALHGSAGYIKSFGGSLSSPSASLGINYRFSFLKAK